MRELLADILDDIKKKGDRITRRELQQLLLSLQRLHRENIKSDKTLDKLDENSRQIFTKNQGIVLNYTAFAITITTTMTIVTTIIV